MNQPESDSRDMTISRAVLLWKNGMIQAIDMLNWLNKQEVVMSKDLSRIRMWNCTSKQFPSDLRDRKLRLLNQQLSNSWHKSGKVESSTLHQSHGVHFQLE